jgi:hypothetical protein
MVTIPIHYTPSALGIDVQVSHQFLVHSYSFMVLPRAFEWKNID